MRIILSLLPLLLSHALFAQTDYRAGQVFTTGSSPADPLAALMERCVLDSARSVAPYADSEFTNGRSGCRWAEKIYQNTHWNYRYTYLRNTDQGFEANQTFGGRRARTLTLGTRTVEEPDGELELNYSDTLWFDASGNTTARAFHDFRMKSGYRLEYSGSPQAGRQTAKEISWSSKLPRPRLSGNWNFYYGPGSRLDSTSYRGIPYIPPGTMQRVRPDWWSTQYRYDAQGRLAGFRTLGVKEGKPLQDFGRFYYNAQGRATATANARISPDQPTDSTVYRYDAQGRLATVSHFQRDYMQRGVVFGPDWETEISYEGDRVRLMRYRWLSGTRTFHRQAVYTLCR